jgi:hypothetical protein
MSFRGCGGTWKFPHKAEVGGSWGKHGFPHGSEPKRIADGVGEERDPAEPALEPAVNPVGNLVPGEARQQAGGGEPLDAHALTAPAVRPKAILRCTSTKKITTGTAVSVAPAISEPQSVPREVVKFASQIVSVCFSWLESRT